MDDRVEAYLDDALALEESERFAHALADDPEWEAELFLAAQIRDGLRALPQPACPPELTRAVIAEVRAGSYGQARRAWPERLRAWAERWWTPYWQPSFAMALLLALVLSATLVGRPAQPPTAAGIEAAEVEAALAEAKWTLAYLSQVGRQTGRSVRHEVLESRVVGPVQEALGTILPEPPNTPN